MRHIGFKELAQTRKSHKYLPYRALFCLKHLEREKDSRTIFMFADFFSYSVSPFLLPISFSFLWLSEEILAT